MSPLCRTDLLCHDQEGLHRLFAVAGKRTETRVVQWKVWLRASGCVRNVGEHVLVFSLPHRSILECRGSDGQITPSTLRECHPSVAWKSACFWQTPLHVGSTVGHFSPTVYKPTEISLLSHFSVASATSLQHLRVVAQNL